MFSNLAPLVVFAFVSSITPGPNNIMLTSSGLRFGFARSLPHMLGITFGFGLMLAMCALGIGKLVMALPVTHLVLKAIASFYLVYLAWTLLRSGLVPDVAATVRPMPFLGAAVFQFANPKAWIMAITGASAFVPAMQPAWQGSLLFCIVFCAVNFPCIGVWAGSGAALRRYLTRPSWRHGFSMAMALLTLYSAFAIWM